MLNPDQVIKLRLTANDLQLVLGALGEVVYRLSSPVIDKIREQVLEAHPNAFGSPAAAERYNVIPMGEASDD